MKRFSQKTLAAALAALCLFLLGGRAFAVDGIESKSVVLMEMATGRILYQLNADERIAPASLTKILTMYTGLKTIEARGLPLETIATVSKAAAQPGGSCMGLRAGERISLDKLLYGMAVASGNDASQAFAEHLGGSHFGFVKEMNQQARLLGMSRSNFQNSHGLPADGQLTTARDMALLARAYLSEFPETLHYHATRAILHNGKASTNKNPFINAVPGVDGLKSGWVRASGYNLVSTAQRDGHRLILVVMGAGSAEFRAQDTLRLLEAGFAALQRNTTVKSELALLKPADFRVNIAAANQSALAELSRPASVTGTIGSPKPAPLTERDYLAVSISVPMAVPKSGADLVVGSIGSPSPSQTVAAADF